MHVPDGFLDLTTSLATGVVAVAAAGVAVRRAGRELDERAVPLAGLTCAFVFAAQMLNFPVGVGTSGHLMGGALAAALVGPWTGVLCLTVVLVVQALLFADGGLTALGTNITLMALTTVLIGWLVTKAAVAVLPRRPASVVPAAAVGAFVSVVTTSLVFVVLYATGGTAPISRVTLTASMVGWHAVIGVGEAVMTALTVSAVVAVRPDLVHAARGLVPRLRLRDGRGELVDMPLAHPPVPDQDRPERPAARGLLIGGGVVTLLLAGVVSSFASSNPDGLEFVAAQLGILDTAHEHLLGGLALAEYGAVGGVPVGIAGVLGVVVTVLIAWLALRATGSRAVRPRTAER